MSIRRTMRAKLGVAVVILAMSPMVLDTSPMPVGAVGSGGY